MKASSIETEGIEGFSERLIELMRRCGINVSRPRDASEWIVENGVCGKSASWDWVSNNAVPKEARLKELVEKITSKIEDKASIKSYMAWLRYGEIKTPFNNDKEEDVKLSIKIIEKVAVTKIWRVEFSIKLIEQIVKLIKTKNIESEDEADSQFMKNAELIVELFKIS